MNGRWLRGTGLLLAAGVFLPWLEVASAAVPGMAASASPVTVLSGHVLPALNAPPVGNAKAQLEDAAAADAPVILTLVLRRTDPEGFQAYLRDVYDPASPNFRHFLTPVQVSERFGPTQEAFEAVAKHFVDRGFARLEAPANRMTLSLEGTRAAAGVALGVRIADYRIDHKRFYANDTDPQLPADIAAHVEAIAGLNSLAVPQPNWTAILTPFCAAYAWANAQEQFTDPTGKQAWQFSQTLYDKAFKKCMKEHGSQAHANLPKPDPPPPAWQGATGVGQKIGVVAFDTFLTSDVSDFITAAGLPPSTLANISRVHVNGGATPGANQDEVLLDIDTILNDAPDAQIIVYDAPFGGAGSSFQAVFNAMISGGVDIITNSWAYCEDQTTLADVQSIDTILQTAAASGISAFSASGDHGSTCLDGKPNTVHVPASSPHITAVGGTSLTMGPGFTYASETWWDGSAAVPPTGQGGYGVSVFFTRPAYQDGATPSPMRSIPDVAFNADPAKGALICQAAKGGCPSGLLYGGTSRSAPQWAAFAALFNQTQGSKLGFLNPQLYPMAGTNAFHDAASMGSDFAHVGLGSPNLARIHQKLTNQTAGAADAAVSQVYAFTAGNEFWVPDTDGGTLPALADGVTPTWVVVRVADAFGNIVEGVTVTLNKSPGSGATITPASGVSDGANGAVIFKVTNLAFEQVTFTATVSPGIVLADKPTLNYIPPPAASGGIAASPTSVPPDGVSATTITITLKDALNRPSPGKKIALAQGGGSSIIVGPDPAITDANGQIQFTARNGVSEIVTYTAVDLSDGNLPVPGSAAVDFTGVATSCAAAPPVAGAGYVLTPFATGFFAQNFNYGNVNWGGCPGASTPTFSPQGDTIIADFVTGDLFTFGLEGGVASDGNKLSNLGPTTGAPTWGKDGRLYATRGSTGGGLFTGNIIEIDPVTGAQVRVVAPNLTCPGGLSVDPLSGDLFFNGQCFGAGTDTPNLWRISDPGGAATLSVYAVLPKTANGGMAFAPDGTLFVAVGYLDSPAQVYTVSGTNKPQPPAIAAVPNLFSYYSITLGEAQGNGAAKSLIVPDQAGLELVDITTAPYTRTLLATGSIGSGVIGPDGCLYSQTSNTVYKLGTTAGDCNFVPTNPAPTLALTPPTVTPNPPQGNTQAFTATFKNVSVPAGTEVTFTIKGANAQIKLGTTNANGAATVSYVGLYAGTDTVTAFTTGVPPLTSNPATVTWTPGKHATWLSLGPTGGTAGTPTPVSATLLDASLTPNAVIAGATVHFVLGAQSCNGITNANGLATCNVTVPAPGTFTLTVSYAGSAAYLPSTASQGMTIFANAAAPSPPGPPTIGTAVPGNGVIVVAFTPPASDGGSPITGYTATCTPAGGGAPVSASGNGSPIVVPGLTNGVTYTCTVIASNGVGPSAASAASNAVTPLAAPGVALPVPGLARWEVVVLAALLLLVAFGTLRRRRG